VLGAGARGASSRRECPSAHAHVPRFKRGNKGVEPRQVFRKSALEFRFHEPRAVGIIRRQSAISPMRHFCSASNARDCGIAVSRAREAERATQFIDPPACDDARMRLWHPPVEEQGCRAVVAGAGGNGHTKMGRILVERAAATAGRGGLGIAHLKALPATHHRIPPTSHQCIRGSPDPREKPLPVDSMRWSPSFGSSNDMPYSNQNSRRLDKKAQELCLGAAFALNSCMRRAALRKEITECKIPLPGGLVNRHPRKKPVQQDRVVWKKVIAAVELNL